jgi:hypothetical protein
VSPRQGERIPKQRKAAKKLQVYVTPYTIERLEKLRARTGKAVSVLARQFIEDGLGLSARKRASSARATVPREELEDEVLLERVQQIMRDQKVQEPVARRLARAERRIRGE